MKHTGGANQSGYYTIDGEGCCWWWLRTPYWVDSSRGWVIDYGGDTAVPYLSGVNGGVRPALWLDLRLLNASP